MGGNFATRCSWSTQVAETVFRKHAALDASLLQVCRSSFCLFVHTDKAQGYWLWEATSPPPPTIYSLLSSKNLWLFSTFEMCLNTSVKKKFQEKCVLSPFRSVYLLWWHWLLQVVPSNHSSAHRADGHGSYMQRNFRRHVLCLPPGSRSVLCFVCITYSLSDFKEMAGEVLSQRLASWLRHLFFFSNQRLLLSKCNNHQEGGIETPTFDLISHRSITVRSAPGFCVQCVT